MNATAGLAGHYVDVVSTIQTDYLVTGVAPFGKYIVSLAYIKGREVFNHSIFKYEIINNAILRRKSQKFTSYQERIKRYQQMF